MNQDDLPEARRRAVHALCLAQARELISVEVFELRHALVHEAPSAAAVDAIIADVQITGDFDAPPLPVPVQPAWITHAAVPSVLPLAAVFSSITRGGQWVVPPVLKLKVVFGEMKLDLRDALFSSDTVEVEVDLTFGSVLLTLPAGTHVENDTTAVFGGSKHQPHDGFDVEPNGLSVHITGRALFGDLKIRERLPTDQLPPERQRGVKGWLARVADSVD